MKPQEMEEHWVGKGKDQMEVVEQKFLAQGVWTDMQFSRLGTSSLTQFLSHGPAAWWTGDRDKSGNTGLHGVNLKMSETITTLSFWLSIVMPRLVYFMLSWSFPCKC